MKVAIYAPHLVPESGGLWQFPQWVVSQLAPKVPTHLVLPDALIEEMTVSGALPSSVTLTSVDCVLESLRGGLAYRMLEAPERGRLLGLRVPGYRKATRHFQRLCFGGPLVSQALLRDLETHDVDIVHVPQQYLTDERVGRCFPYVMNPHDYQHEYFPEYFTEQNLRYRREHWYSCQRAARAIVVHSLQTRDDSIRFLKIPEDRVFYAPYGPLATFSEVDDATAHGIASALGLPERFVFYPSRMWPHKNHSGLLEALRYLKERRGLDVACVFTDSGGAQAEVVAEIIERFELGGQVTTLGRVSPSAMGALYRLCTMVVVPSLFEQNSGPLLEAIHFGKAIAASNLPELAHSLGEGGILFDPRSVEAIASAIDSVFTSSGKQKDLEKRARTRREELSWEPFVETYRQAYAYAAARG